MAGARSWLRSLPCQSGLEPRQVSFKGTKQILTAFAPKIESARTKDRPALINAMLTAVAYNRVGNRPGRWEPRAGAAVEAKDPPDATASHRQITEESLENGLES